MPAGIKELLLLCEIMKARPIELKEANEYVKNNHRHHKPVHRDKFRLAAVNDKEEIIGVIQAARPVSRILDDGRTLEVVRCCTDGTKDTCSFLYSRIARIAKEMGYERVITYILDSETGTSLKACGWLFDGIAGGGSWDTPSRPRKTESPTCLKKRWVKNLIGNEA